MQRCRANLFRGAGTLFGLPRRLAAIDSASRRASFAQKNAAEEFSGGARCNQPRKNDRERSRESSGRHSAAKGGRPRKGDVQVRVTSDISETLEKSRQFYILRDGNSDPEKAAAKIEKASETKSTL
jgi:hypothetical protein